VDDWDYDDDEEDGISRRTAILGGLAGAAAIGALGWAAFRPKPVERDVLYVNTWGGIWEAAARRAYFDPFTAETGIRIRTVSPVSFAKLSAQLRTGIYEFDVTTLGLAELARANAFGLVEPTASHLGDDGLWPGAVQHNSLQTHAYATLISYPKDRFPGGGPQSWADFWDLQRFPGPRCLQRYAARVLGVALLADGVPPDQLMPYDLDRAFASLDRIKPAIRVWWAAGPQSLQILTAREVSMIGIWSNYAQKASLQMAGGLAVQWNQALIDKGCWVVAKDTPRAEAAWKLLRFIGSRPEGLAEFCKSDFVGPLNPQAFDHIDRDIARVMPTWPQNLAQGVMMDAGRLGDVDAMTRRFDEWVAV
jgi:putative spermidine/putrescine transport system substrate-binding protein